MSAADSHDKSPDPDDQVIEDGDELAEAAEATEGQGIDAAGADSASTEAIEGDPQNNVDDDAQGDSKQDEAADLREQLLRLAAELDNYRKRTNRQMDEIRQRARADSFLSILPVLDNLERALRFEDSSDLKPVVEGVQMVAKQFADVLAQQGVKGFKSIDEPFNAQRHDAVSQIPSDTHPGGTILEELEKGYMYLSSLLRPAKVVVSAVPPKPKEIPADDEADTDEGAVSGDAPQDE